MASERFGFEVVIPQDRWAEQVALFGGALVIVGLAGSPLHGALFAPPDASVASLGSMNEVQSQIGFLRRQRNAYLASGPQPIGALTIEHNRFERFIEQVVRA